jgi:hypothetical protein
MFDKQMEDDKHHKYLETGTSCIAELLLHEEGDVRARA